MQRLDVGELAELVVLAPGEEPADGMQVGRPGVLVADGGGEEFQEAARGVLAGVGDDRRHDHGCRRRGDAPAGFGDDQLWVDAPTIAQDLTTRNCSLSRSYP